MNFRRLAPLIIFLLALAIRLGYVVWRGDLHAPVIYDAARYDDVGWSLARGEGFRLHGEPTAYAPPGYPAFLGAVYLAFGHRLAAARLAQCGLGALIALLAFLTARDWRGERAGWAAGVAAAGYPFILYWTDKLLTETLFVFFIVLSLWLTARSTRSARAAALGGLAMGLSALVRPTSLLLPAGVAFWMAVAFWKRPKDGAVRFALFALLFVLPVALWTGRNYKVFGEFIPVKSEGDSSLNFSNNMVLLESIRNGRPIWTAPDAPAELAGKAFILGHPKEWLELAWHKFLWFWKFEPFEGSALEIWASRFSMGVVFPFFLWGFVRFLRDPHGLLAALMVAYFTAMGVMFFPMLRYRCPIEPIIVIIAAAGLSSVFGWTGKREGSQPPAL